MEKVPVTITCFHYDVLRMIIMLVVKSSKGATDVARTMAVCKYFAKYDEDKDVLKGIDFDSVELSNRTALFRSTNGLINKCAQAGNLSAQYLLSKVILATSYKLRKKILRNNNFIPLDEYIYRETRTKTVEDLPTSYLAQFIDNRSSTSNQSGGSLFLAGLVRLFLCRCNVADLVSMHKYLKCYMEMFTLDASPSVGTQRFYNKVDDMYSIVLVLVDHGYNDEDGPWWDEFERDVGSLLRNPYSRSALYFKECERVAELGNEEANIEFADLGEYFFRYLVKKLFHGGVESPDPNVLRDLKFYSTRYARTFETDRINAIKAFDEVFPPK